jgi:hypothetical protein
MSKKKTAKKLIQSEIAEKLLVTFGELKELKNSAKVKRSVRKASKALVVGIRAAQKRQAPVKVKKISPKKSASAKTVKEQAGVAANESNA